MEHWQNAYGETVVLTDAGDLRIVGRDITKKPNAAQSARQARVTPTPAVRVQPKPPTLMQQVRAELAKPGNELVVAHVNEQSGTVETYLAPKDPWAVNAEQFDALKDAVHAAETALADAERADAPWVEVFRLEQSVRSARYDLSAAENQRKIERQRQQVR